MGPTVAFWSLTLNSGQEDAAPTQGHTEVAFGGKVNEQGQQEAGCVASGERGAPWFPQEDATGLFEYPHGLAGN